MRILYSILYSLKQTRSLQEHCEEHAWNKYKLVTLSWGADNTCIHVCAAYSFDSIITISLSITIIVTLCIIVLWL